MSLAQFIEQNNAQHVRIVVRAALEDLAAVRESHGKDSSAYAAQTRRSMEIIYGSLEKVLRAAQTHLEAGHDAHRPPTGTD